jgi:hypothetical protein
LFYPYCAKNKVCCHILFLSRFVSFLFFSFLFFLFFSLILLFVCIAMQTRNQRLEQVLSTFRVESEVREGKPHYTAIWWRNVKYCLEDFAYLHPKKKSDTWIGQIKRIYFLQPNKKQNTTHDLDAKNCRIKIRWMYKGTCLFFRSIFFFH